MRRLRLNRMGCGLRNGLCNTNPGLFKLVCRPIIAICFGWSLTFGEPLSFFVFLDVEFSVDVKDVVTTLTGVGTRGK